MPGTNKNKESYDAAEGPAQTGSTGPLFSKHHMYQINTKRIQRARELDLDFNTISISKATSMILFHGVTDEEMDEKDDGKKLEMVSKWKRWLDDRANETCHEDFPGMMIPFVGSRRPFLGERITFFRVAEAITRTSGEKIADADVDRLVEDAHYDFVEISLPLQIILKLLDDDAWPGQMEVPDLESHRANWLKGAGGKGHLTVDLISNALRRLRPLDDDDLDDWKNLKVAPAIAALERFIDLGSQVDRRKALKRTSEMIDENQYDIYHEPTIIRGHLKARLSHAEWVQHWVELIDYCEEMVGEYAELADAYLLDLGFDIWREVEAARAAGDEDEDDEETPEPLADEDNQNEPEPPAKKRRISDLGDSDAEYDEDPRASASSAHWAFGFSRLKSAPQLPTPSPRKDSRY